jgi:transitional endoplasmic reticulum ATPase
MVGVQVSPTESIQVPWGRIEIPSIEGHLSTGVTVIEGRAVFVLGGVVRKRHMHEVSKIASLTREYAMKRSLYKGRAVRVSFPDDIENMDMLNDAPKFMEINGIKRNELIFSDALREQIDVSVFTPIERTEACRLHGIPLKRGILLEGKYGTGKTLTAHVAAQLCEEHGWTFMYLSDVRQLRQAISLAALYEPCVIFAEDIDRAVSGARSSAMDDILNTIDGVDSKNREIMVILTTNHVEGINKAMLRPGRLDAVISVAPPDEAAVLKLIRLFSRGLLADDETTLKEAGVGTMLAGHIPATIREVVERAKLAAIRREGKLALRASDLKLAAETMLHHLGLMKETQPDNRSDIVLAAGILADAMTQAATENGVGHIANK